MLSMSCNRSHELFGHSLQTKLHFLEESRRQQQQQQQQLGAAAMQQKDAGNDEDPEEDEAGGTRHMIRPSSSSAADDELACSHGWLGDSARRQQRQQHQVHRGSLDFAFPLPGTTFPPRSCAQIDLLKAKYHSETDLVQQQDVAWLEKAKSLVIRELLSERSQHNNTKYPVTKKSCEQYDEDDDDDDLDYADDDEDDAAGQKQQHHHHKQQRQPDADDGNDSDLFFDFDIESPPTTAATAATAASTEAKGLLPKSDDEPPRLQLLHKLDKPASAGGSGSGSGSGAAAKASAASNGGSSSGPSSSSSCSLPRRNSVDSFFSAGGDSSSTAFGSMSSFDGDLQRRHEGEEMSLEPEDWLRKQSATAAGKRAEGDDVVVQVFSLEREEGEATATSCTTPVVASPTAAEEAKEEEELAPKDNSSSSSSDEEDIESFSVQTIDNTTHTVAKSKLNALIALLEKDREREVAAAASTPLARSSSASTMESPTYSETPSKAGSGGKSLSPPGGIHMKKKTYQTSLPTISASPANFSFLIGAEPAKTPSTTSLSSFCSTDNGNFLRVKEIDKASTTQPSKSERLRRASSLKSGKTPPGTPGNRKNVRFADVLGLDLANVKTFRDEIPRVPKSAYHDLTDIDVSDLDSDAGSSTSGASSSSAAARRFLQFSLSATGGPAPLSSSSSSSSSQQQQQQQQSSSPAMSTTLVPMFNQPGSMATFFDLLRERHVCLETAFTNDVRSVQGTVRVQNLSFHKRIFIRYTLNDWASFREVQATYVDGSHDGFSDKFSFALALAASIGIGHRLQMCIRFEAESGEFWDSNDGKNYIFQCLRSVTTSPMIPGKAAGAGAGSRPMSIGSSHYGTYHQPGTSAPYSHSPSSLLGEDPWHRFN